MKISLQWIQEYIDVQEYFERPEALSQILTSAGLEVEEMHNLALQYKHVVTGLILEKDKHPDADKLSVCKVTTGEGVVHQIVCGAKNHKAQDRVIVALPGANLPGNFAIKRAQIRGVDSAGMLCSYKELGITESSPSEGIAILPEDTPLGQPFAQWAKMDDVVFELKVTPNRADCLSHWGLARELSCLLNRPLKAPALPQVHTFKYEGQFQVQVTDPDMCPRYTGRVVRGVKVGPSPQWLKNRLERVGLSSINNVVDMTNYVMMAFGQPLHAFDLALIQGGLLHVGRAQKGENFQTLDGTSLTLKGEELMIQDTGKSLCMAGVIGGKNSGVSDKTTDIFLESAFFASQFVRKSSRSHGITTDSGYRFSRGVDPRETLKVLEMASHWIVQVAGGEVSDRIWEVKSQDFQPAVIEISPQLVSERLGYKVQAADFESWMKRLGCQVELASTGGAAVSSASAAVSSTSSYKISPPSWRFDLEIDMDLVEEYARLHGYEHIPETIPAFIEYPRPHENQFVWQNQIIDPLLSLGWSQAINFAFVGEKAQATFAGAVHPWEEVGLKWPKQIVPLMNPLNEEMNVMRATLLLDLIKNLRHNYHHGVAFGRLFEVGSVFEKGVSSELPYFEKTRMAGVAWGWPTSLWGQSQAPLIMEVKGAIESLLTQLGFREWRWLQPQRESVRGAGGLGFPDFIHSGQAAALEIEGQRVGFIGALHPSLREDLKVRTDICVFELQTEFIQKQFIGFLAQRMSRVQAPSKMPSVERDLALVMPKALSSETVEHSIKKGLKETHSNLLKCIQVVDLYEGDSIGIGKKSVTYRLTFQHNEITLTEEQIQEAIKGVVQYLETETQIRIR